MSQGGFGFPAEMGNLGHGGDQAGSGMLISELLMMNHQNGVVGQKKVEEGEKLMNYNTSVCTTATTSTPISISDTAAAAIAASPVFPPSTATTSVSAPSIVNHILGTYYIAHLSLLICLHVLEYYCQRIRIEP